MKKFRGPFFRWHAGGTFFGCPSRRASINAPTLAGFVQDHLGQFSRRHTYVSTWPYADVSSMFSGHSLCCFEHLWIFLQKLGDVYIAFVLASLGVPLLRRSSAYAILRQVRLTGSAARRRLSCKIHWPATFITVSNVTGLSVSCRALAAIFSYACYFCCGAFKIVPKIVFRQPSRPLESEERSM